MRQSLRSLDRVLVSFWFQHDIRRWISFCEVAQCTAWGWSKDAAIAAMRSELDAEERDLEAFGPSKSRARPLPGSESIWIVRLESGRWSDDQAR